MTFVLLPSLGTLNYQGVGAGNCCWGGLETVVEEVWKLLLAMVLASGLVVEKLLSPALAQFLEAEM